MRQLEYWFGNLVVAVTVLLLDATVIVVFGETLAAGVLVGLTSLGVPVWVFSHPNERRLWREMSKGAYLRPYP